MYCKFCGKEIDDCAVFCVHCGKIFDAETNGQTKERTKVLYGLISFIIGIAVVFSVIFQGVFNSSLLPFFGILGISCGVTFGIVGIMRSLVYDKKINILAIVGIALSCFPFLIFLVSLLIM